MSDVLAPPLADRLVVVARDHFDHRHRQRTPPLLRADPPEVLDAVWAALTDWDPAFPSDAALMEPVLLTVCFLLGRTHVAAVGLKSATATSDRWRCFDRRLRTSAVYDWLRDNDVDLPWPT